jgi:antitoxin component YwqK of YwqJK toxin-antitoxin module
MEDKMKISRGDYDANGKKQGIWIEYTTDSNGKRIMERGSYDVGVRYGEWKRYDLSHHAPQQIKKVKK